MSDHEGAGNDNWEDMSLPGGPTYSVHSRRGQESLDRGIRPRGPDGQESAPTPPVIIPPRRPPGVNPNYRPQIQAITGIAHRPGGIRNRRPYVTPEPLRPPIDNEARRACYEGQPSVAQFDLTVQWKAFLKNIEVPRRQTAAQIARERLDEICQRTNAYIKTPADDEVRLEVWGSEEDASRAVAELQTFYHYTRQIGPRPHREKWMKQHAHDGRVEDRKARNLREIELGTARYELNKQTRFEFQLHLLWPSGVDMKRFREKYEPEKLRSIQENNLCRIDFHNEGVKYLKISTHVEHDIYGVYHRILNMVKEDIAQNGLFSRMNRFRLPRSTMYRDRIGMDRNPITDLYIPTLFGDGLAQNERMDYQQLCRSTDDNNIRVLRNELTSIIRAIQAPGQHVRMRVLFTELGFRQYERPSDDQDYHGFNEFFTMLNKPLTQIEMAGLRNDTDLAQLVDILAKNEKFGTPETRYTLHFDFRGSNDSTLRYEREFYIGYHGELEHEANRWMWFSRLQNDNEVLEFNMLDFEHLRANYQVHVGKIPLYETTSGKERKEHQKALEMFAGKVTYSHAPGGLKAPPQRRVVFPVGNSNLFQHEERITARFHLKDSDARFELIRKDKFVADAGTKKPQSTMWVAQYYYPQWDTLLGEFANLEAGGKVSWPKSLDSFFIPENAYDDNRPLPKGFKGFMAEVEELQEILQEAIESLPAKGRHRATSSVNEVTNGVNGMTVG